MKIEFLFLVAIILINMAFFYGVFCGGEQAKEKLVPHQEIILKEKGGYKNGPKTIFAVSIYNSEKLPPFLNGRTLYIPKGEYEIRIY